MLFHQQSTTQCTVLVRLVVTACTVLIVHFAIYFLKPTFHFLMMDTVNSTADSTNFADKQPSYETMNIDEMFVVDERALVALYVRMVKLFVDSIVCDCMQRVLVLLDCSVRVNVREISIHDCLVAIRDCRVDFLQALNTKDLLVRRLNEH